jgi:hypothetical protein
MQGLIYFQTASSGYIPLTQSHMNYKDASNKNPKMQPKMRGNRDAPVGTASHQHEQVYFLRWNWQYVYKWKSCNTLNCTKLADKTKLSFSFDSPTYYTIIAFPGYTVPITHR